MPMMVRAPLPGDNRSEEQIREHYELEKRLANQLRVASRDQRQTLYSRLYDELFRSLPLHPQHTARADPSKRQTYIASQVAFLRRVAPVRRPVFLEVGPGDCQLCFAISPYAAQVYAVDVSSEITHHA